MATTTKRRVAALLLRSVRKAEPTPLLSRLAVFLLCLNPPPSLSLSFLGGQGVPHVGARLWGEGAGVGREAELRGAPGLGGAPRAPRQSAQRVAAVGRVCGGRQRRQAQPQVRATLLLFFRFSFFSFFFLFFFFFFF